MREANLSSFSWTCLIVQIVFIVVYIALVRYGESADATHIENQKGENEELEENLEKYPEMLDINMMLIGGFGFLMTFLKRHGFSSLGMTILIVVFSTEWSILLRGFSKLGETGNTIYVTMMEALESSLTSAAVLITYGVVLGKLNPLQILILTLIESLLFVINAYIGYTLLGAVDVGGAIFIHTFGAYFGIALSLLMRKKDFGRFSENLEGSTYNSDIFSVVGTVLLWIFWPSFNAILANHDAYHRAILNTYISLLGSTVMTFVISSLLGGGKKLEMVDIQNATLSGGVAVGAIADLMIEPYGALLIGSITGTISCLGFRVLQPLLYKKLKLHDSCGVNNLHGMPGLVSGLLSGLFCYLASEKNYGQSLYIIFPKAAPLEDSQELVKIQEQFGANHHDLVEGGEGRTMETQALMQIAALVITLAIAIVGGAITGLILDVERVFHPLETHKAFNDVLYWNLPDEAEINDYDKKDGEDAEHHQPMITYTDSSGPQVEKTSS